MYELISGTNPFAQANVVGFMNYVAEEGYTPVSQVPPEYILYFEALKKIPDVAADMIDCIEKFLHVDATLRLGSGQDGVRNIKNHNLFIDIDWHVLHDMKAKPPFVPVSKDLKSDPVYKDFTAMMKAIGKPVWMEPYRSGNYYNNW
jgi:hypothetical protein